MSTFYIASSRDRIVDVEALAARLVARGMTNAFSWLEHFTHRCSTETCGIANRMHLARLEIAAAGSATLFIGIERLGRGSHVELGAALLAYAYDDAQASIRPYFNNVRRIILVGSDPMDSVFYNAPGVEHVADMAALYAKLGIDG